MGRSYIVPTVVEVRHQGETAIHKMAWSKYAGRPNQANLEKWVRHYEAATEPGGVNEHLGRLRIAEARLYSQTRGVEYGRYTAPLFQIIE